jgi:hypothetical protein
MSEHPTAIRDHFPKERSPAIDHETSTNPRAFAVPPPDTYVDADLVSKLL